MSGVTHTGFDVSALASIEQGRSHAQAVLMQARARLANMTGHRAPGMASFVLGSVGRGEASEASDLDVAFLYDATQVEPDAAQRTRQRFLQELRCCFEVPEKTFVRPVALQDLCRTIGGMYDTNEQLTYRALILTEGQWLHNSVVAQEFVTRIYAAYTRPQTSRGKFLSCLANDLHRYYRTLCVDYRFKVEEQSKPWAIRALKLRYSRKLWHLSNLALQCWFVDRFSEQGSQEGAQLLERLNLSPLEKLSFVADYFERSDLLAPLLGPYDLYLLHLSDAQTRAQLRGLAYASRHESELYRGLRDQATRFDDACAAWFDLLMERCRGYLLRYCVF